MVQVGPKFNYKCSHCKHTEERYTDHGREGSETWKRRGGEDRQKLE